MAVSERLYRPTLIDEHLDMRDVDNDGDLDATLCRAAATAMALDAMTLGEWTRTPKGERWGRARIKTLLKRMRAATEQPNRSGYNQSHVPAFVKGAGFPTDIIRIYNKPMSDIKQKLKDGFVVTLAGDVAGTPAGSPLRKYVNPGVGHEIIITRVSGDGKRAAFIDPMTRHGTSVYERWAPWPHFVGFAKRFVSNGNAIAEIWKRGRLTEAKEVARDRAVVILKVQTALADLQKLWEKQQRELISQDETIAKLTAQVEQLSGHEHVAALDKVRKARSLLELVEADLQ
jgi:hypothetical protein